MSHRGHEIRAERRSLDVGEAKETAKLLRESLDAMALDPRIELENASLRKELERARREAEAIAQK